jgi:hypothetical protein
MPAGARTRTAEILLAVPPADGRAGDADRLDRPLRRARRTFGTHSPIHGQPIEMSVMTATYTFDVFSSLDGFGAHVGDWGGYWGKQGR